MIMTTETNNITPPALPREHWLNRLRYRASHRGSKETDLILGRYAQTHLLQLDDDALHLFEAFLEEDDSDIWNWLVEKTPCPNAEYGELLENLRQVKLF